MTATPLSLVDTWPAATVAAAIVGPEGPRALHGPVDQPFPLASVTKLLVALAVHVAVEEGALTLDQVVADGDATVAHLLAHASGLGPDGTRIAPVGSRRIYSNAGYERLGDAVAEATEIPFAAYLHEAIADPLGLTATALGGSPAHGASSSTRDLACVAQELLAPTRLLAPSTVGTLRTVAFPGLDGVLPGFGTQRPNDWGLGPEVRGLKCPHWTGSNNSPATFGHFGQAGTFMWVDPVAECALIVLTDEPFGAWAADAWPSLSDAVLQL